MKKIVSCLLVLLLLFGTFGTIQAKSENIAVTVNGRALLLDVAPVMKENRVLVPFRAIAEALEVSVYWDDANRTVQADTGLVSLSMPVDSKTVTVNGKEQEIDVPALIVDSRTMVPIRVFSEIFAAQVLWVQESHTVEITKELSKPEKYVYGYYFVAPGDIYDNSMNSLSGYAYKWYTMDENGALITRNTSGINRPSSYQDILAEASGSGKETYMLLFRYKENLNTFLQDKSQQEAFIDAVLEEAVKDGYTGVDVDMEGISNSNLEAFNTFLRALSDKLKTAGKKLAISVPAKTGSETWNLAYDYEFIGKICDQVTIMTYDKDPSTNTAQSPIGWVENCVKNALQYIPKEKLLLGIGYYGYDFSSEGGKSTAVNSDLPNLSSMTGLKRMDLLISQYGGAPKLDESSKVMQYTYTTEDGISRTVWYESPESVKEKLNLVLTYDLKGISLWQLGFCDEALFRVIEDTFTVK